MTKNDFILIYSVIGFIGCLLVLIFVAHSITLTMILLSIALIMIMTFRYLFVAGRREQQKYEPIIREIMNTVSNLSYDEAKKMAYLALNEKAYYNTKLADDDAHSKIEFKIHDDVLELFSKYEYIVSYFSGMELGRNNIGICSYNPDFIRIGVGEAEELVVKNAGQEVFVYETYDYDNTSKITEAFQSIYHYIYYLRLLME